MLNGALLFGNRTATALLRNLLCKRSHLRDKGAVRGIENLNLVGLRTLRQANISGVCFAPGYILSVIVACI